jgi:hypothetical protein
MLRTWLKARSRPKRLVPVALRGSGCAVERAADWFSYSNGSLAYVAD